MCYANILVVLHGDAVTAARAALEQNEDELDAVALSGRLAAMGDDGPFGTS